MCAEFQYYINIHTVSSYWNAFQIANKDTSGGNIFTYRTT